jgi:hypothetical protein
VIEISKDAAIEAVRGASWAEQVATCGHRGCEDHVGDGKRYIHVFSGFGMDMPLDGVEEEIRAAQRVGWIDHLLRHDLAAVTAEGRTHCYDVRRPAEVSA